MKIASILLLVILTASCAGRMAQNSPARITLPEPPKRIAIHEDGVPHKAGVEYIDPPIRIEPGRCTGVQKTGGALLSPRSWRAIRYELTEWPKWGATVQSIVDSHNRAVEPPRDTRSWWSLDW